MSKYDFLDKELDFLYEIDKLKSIYRKTVLLDKSRNENSAEHSWQLALAVISFLPYIKDRNQFDELKAIKMALVHDIVEIDAGDIFVYGDSSQKQEKELQAANRIFSLNPSGAELKKLWLEFEEKKCQESLFVSAIDRLLPILINVRTNGHSWKENNITYEQVVEYNRPKIVEGFPEIWFKIEKLLLGAVENKFLSRR